MKAKIFNLGIEKKDRVSLGILSFFFGFCFKYYGGNQLLLLCWLKVVGYNKNLTQNP
jgi:hypothetical protein